ncbi:hypothetical protein D9613_002817 [Agrocybe pediades]|uniref:Endonuclease/exonuclease/phosphatase domain-containing protein n=1 Tax=Agrocybe pediades TaxID=84607 RepID=A0A8H4VLU7_9AGAR|nr:hypothetical protein D9613_002817 [Agrocybe pediades]
MTKVITSDEIQGSLLRSPLGNDLPFARNARLVRNSPQSTMGTAYLDIWDSKSGSRAKKLINQSVMICGLRCFIREASAHVGTPISQRCWKWGHSEAGCRQRAAICPHCMGPHRLEEHRTVAKCCKGNAKANPPIPPTPADQDCPHKAHCVNCGGDHAASNRKCKFWVNRYDRTWIEAKYRENSFDVLFVQEPPWRTIRQAPSPNNRDGEDIVGAPMHPAWLYMVRPPTNDETPRVMAFVSKRLERLRPSMRRDLADHRDIFILSLFQDNETYHLMNVYNDADGTAVRYLSNHVHELPQLHYMGGDFNIHSREWDPEVTHHRGDAINLLELAADLDLERTQPSNPGPTFISHNPDLRPSVIDLVFHGIAESASDCTFRDPVRQGPSDHIPIFTVVKLDDEIEPVTRRTIPRDSEAEQAMRTELPQKVADIQVGDLETREDVERVAQALADAYAEAWMAHSKVSRITKHSQPWWNNECSAKLATYRNDKSDVNWYLFRDTVKRVKRNFFETRIGEIAYANRRPWDLMEWVKQRKLPACEAIRYQGQPCHGMDSLWNALHNTYNSASGRVVDMSVLDPLPNLIEREWPPFSALELSEALESCSSRSSPGPDHITWSLLKEVMLGSSTRGLSPKEKRLLYRSCVLPITTYGYRLWFYEGARIKGVLADFRKMQRKAALWITGAFRTSPTGGVESLAGLIPIHLHLKKLAGRSNFRAATLSDTHPLRSILSEDHRKQASAHPLAISRLTPNQRLKVKGSLMEVDRHLPELTESFAPVAPEARPGVRLLDRFPDRVEFHGTEGLLDERSLEAYRTKLNTVLTEAREQPGTVICAVDASLPNEEHRHAVSAALLFRGVERVHTAIHPAGRVTAPDAELFAICSAVCLAVQQDNCERIVVFTDSLTSAKRAVDPTLHSGQGHSLAVCRALEPWLAEDADCSITFIQVPSKLKWKIHQEAHDECRAFNAPAVQHPSTSLDSVRRAVTKSVQEDWKILFRDPVYRGHNFLMLQRPDETVLEPSYINGDASSTTLQSGPIMNASIYRSERRAPVRITPSRRAIIFYVIVANTNVTKTVHLQGITLGWLDSWSRTKQRSPSDDPKGSVEQPGQVPDWSGGVIYNNNI